MATIFNANTTEGLVITPDTSGEMVFQSNGTQVLKVTGATGSFDVPVGTTAERPTSPTTGTLRYNTTEGELETYDGSAWTGVGSLPDQTGNSGKYLTTDGSTASWGDVTAGIEDNGTFTTLTVSGGATIKDVTGNYGSIEVDGGSTGGYEGYSIGGRAVFMHNNSTTTGIFNDVNNHWILRGVHGGLTSLYYNGSEKLQTTSSGATISGNLYFNSGYGSNAIAYGVRAWVNFRGTSTVLIRGSANVSSISDLGNGRYRVNFSTAMPDANYAIALGASSDSATVNRNMHENNLNRTTSRCDVSVCDMNGSEQDEDRLSVSIVR